MALSRHDIERGADDEPYWTALHPAPPEENVPESPEHYEETSEGHGELRWLLRQRAEQAVVLANTAMYYVLKDDAPVVLPKERRAVPAGLTVQWVAPDLMVLPGYERTRGWSVYPLYLEGVTPLWVMEAASPSTYREDVKEKVPLYQTLGIPELLLFNPPGKLLYPKRLQGLRLNPETGKYFDATTPSGEVTSEGLRVTFFLQEHRLRIRDDLTGMVLPTRDELTQQAANAERERRIAERERRTEARRREKAENQVAALLDELARLRADRRE